MLDFDSDLDARPKCIHIGYSYASSDLPIDETIVRRIRFDIDPLFVPVVKKEVFRYQTGGTREFVHFGIGVEHSPGLPIIDPEVYGALKPFFGYLSEIGRASFVAVWVQGPPFAPESKDGTPGETVPFDERIYAHAKECDAEMRRRAEAAKDITGNGDTDRNTIPGVNDEIRQLAYRAITTTREERAKFKTKAKDAAFEQVRYVLKEDKAIHTSFLDLTDDDRAMMGALFERGHDRKNAVHFIPAAPASPGSIIVVPR